MVQPLISPGNFKERLRNFSPTYQRTKGLIGVTILNNAKITKMQIAEIAPFNNALQSGTERVEEQPSDVTF